MINRRILVSICLLTFAYFTYDVDCHGRLLDPSARSSLWRIYDSLPKYYDDNQMFCGGANVEYSQNGGKCGICGEAYNSVKQFEKGGKFYTGIIARKYNEGDLIDATIEITANHRGWSEFRLCNVDSVQTDATQDCLDKIVLRNSDGQSRIYLKQNYTGKLTYKLRLPTRFSCKHCVLQWKYNAGNSYGVAQNGTGCIGCGNQEQFYGCSDISIISRSGVHRRKWPNNNNNLQQQQQQQISNDVDINSASRSGVETVKVPKKLLKQLLVELRRLKEVQRRYDTNGESVMASQSQDMTERSELDYAAQLNSEIMSTRSDSSYEPDTLYTAERRDLIDGDGDSGNSDLNVRSASMDYDFPLSEMNDIYKKKKKK